MILNRASTLVGWRVVCALLLVLVTETAHVGQWHIQKIGLEELIRRSTVIVIAEPDEPSTVEERVAIKERGRKPPAYVRIVHRFRVRESLRGNLAPGTAIAVIPADDALQERLHRDYHTQGLSRHVVVKDYEPLIAYVPDQPRILFLIGNGERYAFTTAGGTEGLARRSEVVSLLGQQSGGAGEAREAIVDRALRKHGDSGVYGDLRAGLADISKRSKVGLTNVKEGIRVDIVPPDGQGHEYQFVVTAAGAIENFMAAEREPARAEVPKSLRFRFNAVALTKEGETITLTLYPVWPDAQLGPPPGFEDNVRTRRLSQAEFRKLYRQLEKIDFKRYARLTDNDFTRTPPDLSHTEMLHFSVDGREVVSWGKGHWFLKAELRAPLQALEQELTQWASTRPLDPADFTRLVLRDVQGLHGGRNVYVGNDGNVTVQAVTPTETGLREQRFEFRLTDDERQALRQLLVQHPPRKIRIPLRPGIPDQARPEITLVATGGLATTIAKWDDERHPDFDALYARLQHYEAATKKRRPVWEGRYDHDWRPAGF